MPDPMLQATKQLLAYVPGVRPPEGPNPLPQALVPWGADLRTQEKGGSGNKGWLAWLVQYTSSNGARIYFLDRLRWELRHGLMAHEQTTVTYGGLHLGCVVLLWYIAWSRGDEELCMLAGAWIERVLLLECLTGRREGDRIRLLSPGMRADVRSVTHGRQVEGAIVGRLLGIPQDLRLDHSTWWGPLWDCIRGLEGVGLAVSRVSDLCRTLLTSTPRPSHLRSSTDFQRIRLMVPMTFRRWPDGSWFASLARSTGASQDPACMGQGVIGGKHAYLWLWGRGNNPPEEGWRSDCLMTPAGKSLHAEWWWKGSPYGEQTLLLPEGWSSEIIGGPSGPDPLADPPPAPPQGEHPWRQGGRGRPGPEVEEPQEPVDVPWDLGELRRDLQDIRDNHDRTRRERRTAHRALATLDRLGAWEGLEEEARDV